MAKHSEMQIGTLFLISATSDETERLKLNKIPECLAVEDPASYRQKQC